MQCKKRKLKLSDQGFSKDSGPILAKILENNTHFTSIEL